MTQDTDCVKTTNETISVQTGRGLSVVSMVLVAVAVVFEAMALNTLDTSYALVSQVFIGIALIVKLAETIVLRKEIAKCMRIIDSMTK